MYGNPTFHLETKQERNSSLKRVQSKQASKGSRKRKDLLIWGEKYVPCHFLAALLLTARADLEDEVEREADLSNAFLSWVNALFISSKISLYLFFRSSVLMCSTIDSSDRSSPRILSITLEHRGKKCIPSCTE